ncbi:hypothetical protein AGLY_007318 [Aphis glycines]|uniref:Uncharacterized protein n=1 Tax=Aphis glycines TaxID=307491 RepID=A0A6G0TP78_APHGL|nr:hypothetical protein AGLY_007318 [Aphis glycines]
MSTSTPIYCNVFMRTYCKNIEYLNVLWILNIEQFLMPNYIYCIDLKLQLKSLYIINIVPINISIYNLKNRKTEKLKNLDTYSGPPLNVLVLKSKKLVLPGPVKCNAHSPSEDCVVPKVHSVSTELTLYCYDKFNLTIIFYNWSRLMMSIGNNYALTHNTNYLKKCWKELMMTSSIFFLNLCSNKFYNNKQLRWEFYHDMKLLLKYFLNYGVLEFNLIKNKKKLIMIKCDDKITNSYTVVFNLK